MSWAAAHLQQETGIQKARPQSKIPSAERCKCGRLMERRRRTSHSDSYKK
ncbi:unnamed protein product [Tenebrio molitor]|nr:unnamed protein product [Tenebrio molitor]